MLLHLAGLLFNMKGLINLGQSCTKIIIVFLTLMQMKLGFSETERERNNIALGRIPLTC
jgi:hypothetical protein